MMNKPAGIVMATHWEAGPVIRAFGLKRIQRGLYQGTIENRRVLLALSGVGREPAREASYRLCSEGAGELISAGFCGALVSDLKVGDLVTHRIITVDRPARTAKERIALTERTNPVAVDMESQAVIEAGTRRGVPIRVCRIVSDRLEDDLTPLFGTDDGFSPIRIGFRLLNPSVWPLAARLKRHSDTAATRLIAALRDCVQGHGPFADA
jgi:nucleoside phosphorylase